MLTDNIACIILGLQSNINIDEMLKNKEYKNIFLSNDYDDKCLALLILYTIRNINIENHNEQDKDLVKKNFKNIIDKLLTQSNLHNHLAMIIIEKYKNLNSNINVNFNF